MDFAHEYADMAVSMRYEDLSAHTVEMTKRLVLDALGVAIAGSSTEEVAKIVALVEEWGGQEACTLLHFGRKVPATHAVLANSVMIHALDFDDTHDGAVVHACVTNLPAALAVAERRGGVSGKEFLLALNLGIDLTCRMGLAIGGSSDFETRPINFIRSAVCGCFGACLVAGKLLGFSIDQMVNALGIVLSQVGGTRQVVVDSAMTKRYQPAFAAQAGVLSALLGEKGLTGCRDVFEGPYGFFNSYWGGHYLRRELTQDLGHRFEAVNISIKPYPCCRYNHGAIDAALQSRAEFGISADEVTSVSIRLSEQRFYDVVSRPFAVGGNPTIDGQFSMPYTVASALIDGHVFLDTFEPATVRQEFRKVLADKVRVKRDLPVKDKKSLGPVVYEITPTEGPSRTLTVEHFKGSPQNPMSRQDCVEKFKRCVNHVGASFSKAQITRLIEWIFELETLEDVTSIIHPL